MLGCVGVGNSVVVVVLLIVVLLSWLLGLLARVGLCVVLCCTFVGVYYYLCGSCLWVVGLVCWGMLIVFIVVITSLPFVCGGW